MKVIPVDYKCPVIRSPQWSYFRIKLSPLILGTSCSNDLKIELVLGISNYTSVKRINSHENIEQCYAIVYDGKLGYSIFDTMTTKSGSLQTDIDNVIRKLGGFSITNYEVELIPATADNL